MNRRDLAVVILAVSLGAALIIVTIAVMWAATHNGKPGVAVTEQDVQLLTGWGGGIIGIIGAAIGFRAGDRRNGDKE